MRIAHIVWGLGVGGLENMLVDIVNIQCEKDDVTIYVVNDIVDDLVLSSIDKRVHIIQISRKPGSRNPLSFIKLNLLLLSKKPDIVHCHDSFFARILLVRAPKILTFHSVSLPVTYAHLYDKCCAISKEVQNDLKNRGVESELVENGVPVSMIQTKTVTTCDNEVHLIQVARILFEQKGQDIVISALEKLVGNISKKLIVHFVGDGPDMGRLKSLVIEKRLQEYVILEGNKSRGWVYSHLKDFDLFLMPSRFEGFGLSVVEAGVACLPMIVCNIDGPMGIINDGELGWTFNSDNSDELVYKIKEFLENGYPADMIENARKHIADRYDISNTVSEYRRIYESLCNRI